jgi:hypothetical protein
MPNLKRISQILMSMIFISNAAFVAVNDGISAGVHNFMSTFVMTVLEVLILGLGGFWE